MIDKDKDTSHVGDNYDRHWIKYKLTIKKENYSLEIREFFQDLL